MASPLGDGKLVTERRPLRHEQDPSTYRANRDTVICKRCGMELSVLDYVEDRLVCPSRRSEARELPGFGRR